MAARTCSCGQDLEVLPSGGASACRHCDVPCPKYAAEQLCVFCDRIGIKRAP